MDPLGVAGTAIDNHISPSATVGAEGSLSPTDEALLQELTRELTECPPLKCSISYTGPGNEELVNDAIVCIQVHAIQMRRRHPWLDFSALDSVVIHQDYAQALRDVSLRTGSPCQATSRASGAGLAMVVDFKDKCIAVIDAGLAHNVLDQSDMARSDLCVDTVSPAMKNAPSALKRMAESAAGTPPGCHPADCSRRKHPSRDAADGPWRRWTAH